MLRRHRRLITCLGLILFFLSQPVSYVRADGWKSTLPKQLTGIYPLTKTVDDRIKICRAGIALVIQKGKTVGD